MNVSYSTSLGELEQFVPAFAKELRGGEVIGLIGDLGAGKTTFTQMLGKELGITDRITSPTFVMMQFFKGTLPHDQKAVTLYHLDIYRTDDYNEVVQLGLPDFMGQPDTITVLEWADKIRQDLPTDTIFISFK